MKKAAIMFLLMIINARPSAKKDLIAGGGGTNSEQGTHIIEKTEIECMRLISVYFGGLIMDRNLYTATR